jgi:hypothetical protein
MEQTLKGKALIWWNNLTVKLKKDYVDIHYYGRTFASITPSEIQHIYEAEHQTNSKSDIAMLWWNNLSRDEKRTFTIRYEGMGVEKIYALEAKDNSVSNNYAGKRFRKNKEVSNYIYTISEHTATNIFYAPNEKGMQYTISPTLFEDKINAGLWVILEEPTPVNKCLEANKSNIVICSNCKSFHYKGIKECPNCNHTSFQYTHQSNAQYTGTYKSISLSDEVLVEAIQNLNGFINTPVGRRNYPKDVVEQVQILNNWLINKQNK